MMRNVLYTTFSKKASKIALQVSVVGLGCGLSTA